MYQTNAMHTLLYVFIKKLQEKNIGLEESNTRTFAQFSINGGSPCSYYLQHKHEFKHPYTHKHTVRFFQSARHQQVKIITTQARGGTLIPITGMNYNIYTACFICGWQTDGSVAF